MEPVRSDRYLICDRDSNQQPVFGLVFETPEITVGLALPVDLKTAQKLLRKARKTMQSAVIYELVIHED